MKITLTSTLFFIALFCGASSLRFKQSIGGSSPDIGYCARQTYDNGYIAVGSTGTDTSNSDIYVVRTDSNGIVMWSKKFGSPNTEVGRYVEELKDSSLIIVGYTNDTGGNGYDVELLRLDRWGNLVWKKTYGGSDWEFGYSVHQTTDGGFIIAGGTYSYGKGNEDVYLIKTNNNGDTLWTKTYGGLEDDEARSIRQTADGGFILTGSTKSFADVNGDAYVIKTDNNGDTLWTKTFGGTKEDGANDIIECNNGDFALCGRTYSYSTLNANFYLVRIQNNGGLIWARSDFGKDTTYDSLEGITETPNNGLASIGVTNSQSFGSGINHGYLLIVGQGGNFKNGPVYATDKGDETYSVYVTRDNGYIICGFTDSTSTGFGASNLFLLKTDSSGYLPKMKFYLSVSENNKSLMSSATIYPNPFSNETQLIINTTEDIHLADLSLVVTDISGQTCPINYQITSVKNNNVELQLYRDGLQPGIYFIQYSLHQKPVGISKMIIAN